MADRAGQQLGNYKLARLLGRGGFAEVYLGEHVRLGTQAAIKVLSTQLATEDEAIFQQEARTIAALEHPHIVRVLDFDVQDGTPFLVMSYAANGTLRTRHPRGTRLSLEIILPYIKQVADALSYAHDEKLIHRDIKPENMLLGKRQEVLLSDFGIATVAQSSRYQGTQEVAGTVAYMAPEQVQGKPRPASDQYSLGVVIYEWLAGERPFHGSFTEIATQHVLTPPPPLREKLPDLSPTVEQAVLIALSKDPKERFGSVQAFATALEQATLLSQPMQYIRPPIPLSPAPIPPQTSAVTPVLPVQNPAMGAPPIVSEVDAGLPPEERPEPSPSSAPSMGTLQVTYLKHSSWVYALAWSPDGTRIASAGQDGQVHIWDSATGENMLTYQSHGDTISTLAWSPDGTHIASAGRDGQVRVWSSTSGQLICAYHAHSADVLKVAWSSDGQRIASGGADKVVHIWGAFTGDRLLTYRGHHHRLSGSAVFALVWSRDNSQIISGSEDGTVQRWSAYTGEKVFGYVYAQPTAIKDAAWSPDENLIAAASKDGRVYLWTASTGMLITILHGHAGAVQALAWSRDSRYLTAGGDDGTVRAWDVGTQKDVYSYQGHTDTLWAIGWSPDGTRIASSGRDKTVQIWSIEWR